MGLAELLLLAAGLSMDAFAVAICKGLSFRTFTLKKAAVVGLYFGLFQAIMPLLGWLLGTQFKNQLMSVDHWIAFILLGLIGAKMIVESRKEEPIAVDGLCREREDAPRFSSMLPLALATSVDALAVGVTFAFLRVNIFPAAALIGTVTFLLSVAGVKIGHLFGARFERWAELAGGVILIGLGCKILLEHLGVFPF